MSFPLALAPEQLHSAFTSSAELPLVSTDSLLSLLSQAAESELDGLVACLVEKGGITCQLKRLSTYKQNQPHHRIYLCDLVADLQKFGANTLATAFRSGKGIPYSEIAEDVGSRLGVGRHGTTAQIERRILEKLGEKYWEGASQQQRLAMLTEFGVRDHSLVTRPALPAALITAVHVSGFAAYQFSVIVANAVAHAVLGHGLSLVANAGTYEGTFRVCRTSRLVPGSVPFRSFNCRRSLPGNRSCCCSSCPDSKRSRRQT